MPEKDAIKIEGTKEGNTQAYSPNTAPGGKSAHGANFEFCDPDGSNKDAAKHANGSRG